MPPKPGAANAGTLTAAMGTAISTPATAIFLTLLRTPDGIVQVIDHSLHRVDLADIGKVIMRAKGTAYFFWRLDVEAEFDNVATHGLTSHHRGSSLERGGECLRIRQDSFFDELAPGDARELHAAIDQLAIALSRVPGGHTGRLRAALDDDFFHFETKAGKATEQLVSQPVAHRIRAVQLGR